ncbi:MAG: DUF4893 domain-containing protein [Rhodobacteraceae bacterium]|jgi:hypothetical protein|nr:DUF4893 domain-containing protein [Paracoccaceae bacterium]
MPHLPALALPLWLSLATAAVAQDSAPSWQALAAPLDRARIDRAWATFDALLPRVRAAGPEADRTALDAALASDPRPFEAAEMTGDWRCRTIKLGGIGGGITAYGWFACRVDPEEGVLWFQKLTGSQRASGAIHDDAPDRMILLGALHYHYEAPQPYAGPGTPDPDRRNMGGIVTMRGQDAVILFPEPHYESEADLLHMVRP